LGALLGVSRNNGSEVTKDVCTILTSQWKTEVVPRCALVYYVVVVIQHVYEPAAVVMYAL